MFYRQAQDFEDVKAYITMLTDPELESIIEWVHHEKELRVGSIRRIYHETTKTYQQSA